VSAPLARGVPAAMLASAMRFSLLVLLVAGSVAGSVAHADPAADASKAFTAFVTSVASGAPTPGLALFITPFSDDAPVPADLGAVKQLLDKPKVKIAHAAVSRGGKSAWLVGEVTAKLPNGARRKAGSLRVSALLGLGADGWRVQATQWSAGVPNHATDRCGNIEPEWRFTSDVAKDLAAPVQAVLDAFAAMPVIADSPFGGDRSKLLALISDDRGTVVLGSAAGERFVGGKAIKALFKKWHVTHTGAPDDFKGIPARAAAGPDGELMWMYTATRFHEQCTDYRSFFVLAKEPAGWRLVHQHYSEHI